MTKNVKSTLHPQGTAGAGVSGAKVTAFADISDAFAACRSADKPMTVLIGGKRVRVYPSGRSAMLCPSCHGTGDEPGGDCARCLGEGTVPYVHS